MSSTLTPAATGSFAPSTSRLALSRVDSAEPHVELADQPVTIGSGPKCSLRLEGVGLRPLHCVVTPTDSGPVARSWAPGSLLNGEEFTETPLTPGDRLRVGEAEFLVADQAEEEQGPTEEPVDEPVASADEPVAEPTTEPPTEIEEPAATIEGIEAEIASLVEEQPADLSDAPVEPVAEQDPFGFADAEVEVDLESSAADPAPADPPEQPAWEEPESPAWTTEASAADAFQETTPSAEADPAWSVDDPWAEVTPVDTPDAPPALESPGFIEEAPGAVDAWEAEYTPAAPEAPFENTPAVDAESVASFISDAEAPFPEQAAPQPPVGLGGFDEPTSHDVDSFAAEVAPEVPAPAALSADAEVTLTDSAQARLSAGRQRVRRLTQALRECRDRIANLEAAAADRDAAITLLETRLGEAVDAASAAASQLNDRVEAEERLNESEAALAAATTRVAELEERLAGLEQAASIEPVATTDEPVGVSPEPEVVEPEGLLLADAVPVDPAEEASFEPVAPIGEAEAEVAEPLESEASIDPFADASLETAEPAVEPETLTPAYDGIPADPFAEASLDSMAPAPELAAPEAAEPEAAWGEAPAQPSQDESLTDAPGDAPAEGGESWGIEQLASGMPGDSPLWGETVAEPVAELEAPLETTIEDAPVVETMAEVAEAEPDLSHLLAGAEAPSEPDETASLAEEPAQEEAPVDIPQPLAAFQPPAEKESGEPVGEESFISKYAHLLPDDDAEAEPVAPVEPVPVAVEEPVQDEDDSIDDYMRRLMDRVRGGAEPVEAPKASSAPAAAAPAAPAPAVSAPEPEPEPVVPIKDLSELKRNQAAEPKTDIDALRKLANQSARHAIDVAATNESREKAMLKLTIAAVALGCGLFAAFTASSLLGGQFFGGLTAAGFGGWFGANVLKGRSAKAQS